MIQSVVITDWLPTMSANGSHGHWSKARRRTTSIVTLLGKCQTRWLATV